MQISSLKSKILGKKSESLIENYLIMGKNMESDKNIVVIGEDQWSIPRMVSIFNVQWTISGEKFVLILSKLS